ncbi:hypothetical protein MMC34_001220 [Xylographa carneopallida]|nr:hypothetical protein [Xylographa carneopallida]
MALNFVVIQLTTAAAVDAHTKVVTNDIANHPAGFVIAVLLGSVPAAAASCAPLWTFLAPISITGINSINSRIVNDGDTNNKKDIIGIASINSNNNNRLAKTRASAMKRIPSA